MSKPTNGPSEFADMWKELKLKENTPIDSGTDSKGVHSPGENTVAKTGETLIKVCQSIMLCQHVYIDICQGIRFSYTRIHKHESIIQNEVAREGDYNFEHAL